MVWSHDQPATEQKGNVENTSAYNEAENIRSSDFQSAEQHVVAIKIAKKAKKTTPLTKHS